MIIHKIRRSPVLPLAGLLLAAIAVIGVRGDFPLNDDWVYGKTVQTLVDQHQYERHPFAAASATFHVFWGAMFAWPAGFSYTALRLSTLVMALMACWAVTLCARKCGAPKRPALLAGVCLLANPIFLNLSFTYMTDVPFTAISALAGFFYLRAMRTHRLRWVLAGSIFAVVAYGFRQFGVCVTGAYALARLWEMRQLRRQKGLHAAGAGSSDLSRLQNRPEPALFLEATACLLPWFACGLAILLTPEPATPYPWDKLALPIPAILKALLTFHSLFASWVYMGLFILPLSPLLYRSIREGGEPWPRRPWQTCLLWAMTLDLFACLVCLIPMPLLTNILYDFGAGPWTLRDTAILAPGTVPIHVSRWLWWLFTLACLAAAAMLATGAQHARKRRRPFAGRDIFLVLWVILLILAPHHPRLPIVYDRYLLPAAIPALAFATGRLSSRNNGMFRRLGWVIATGMFLFSIASTQDYMAWNRARWTALDTLITRQGVDPLKIDGGYEYNGMYTSGAFMERENTRDFTNRGPLNWWVMDDAYAISLISREGFNEINREPYFSMLGMTTRYLLVLRKDKHE